MVKVTKDGKVRELANDIQASVFLRDGWKIVKEEPVVAPIMNPPEVAKPEKIEEPVVEPKEEPVVAPKRRGRRAK